MSAFRRPHRKTRTGCIVCKQRRIKCDEGKPRCLRCKKRNLDCSYISNDSLSSNSSSSPKLSDLPKIAESGKKSNNSSSNNNNINNNKNGNNILSTNFSTDLPNSYVSPLNEVPDSVIPSSFIIPSPQLNDENKLNGRIILNQQEVVPNLPKLVYSNSLNGNSISSISSTTSTGTTNTTNTSEFNYPYQRIIPSQLPSFNNAYIPPPIQLPNTNNNIYNNNTNTTTNDNNNNNNNNSNDKDNNENKHFFVKQEFLSNKTYSEGLKQFGSPLFFEYIFYSEINFKLTLYMMNTLPFRLCKDPTNRVLFVTNLQVMALYDFLFHAFKAVTFMDLYYQQIMTGSDDVLNLNPKTYLQLGDYHLNRSLALMSNEVKVKEGIRKSIALIVTSTLQIFYYTCNPNSRLSTKNYYELGESLGLLFADSVMAIVNNEVIRDSCARYCINEWSLQPSDYFPEFLYDIIDTDYNDNINDNINNNSNLIPVKQLSNDEKIMLHSIVDRLKKEYRAYANQTVRSNPISSSRFIPIESLLNTNENPKEQSENNKDNNNNNNNNNSNINNNNTSPTTMMNNNSTNKIIEYDMLGTMSRFIVDVPRSFIDLISEEDPRALILSGYNVIALCIRKYEYWPNSVYIQEIEYIDSILDRYQGSNYWKSWLNVARTIVNEI